MMKCSLHHRVRDRDEPGDKDQDLKENNQPRPQALKLLPCLHLICYQCLCYEIENLEPSSIFSCPVCLLKVQVPKNGLYELPDFTLTATYESIRPTTESIVIDTVTGSHCDADGQAGRNLDNKRPAASQEDTQSQTQCLSQGQGELDEKCETRHQFQDLCFCITCDKVVLVEEAEHQIHQTAALNDVWQNKSDYIEKLLSDLQKKQMKMRAKLQQIGEVQAHLDSLHDELVEQIDARAEHLCQMVLQRKHKLLEELDRTCEAETAEYTSVHCALEKDLSVLQYSCDFAIKILNLSEQDNIQLLNLHNNLSSRLLQLVHEAEHDLEITVLKLDVPESGKEETLSGKFYGTLVQGTITCESAEEVASFDIDLQWPTGLATTKDKNFVVVGKTGALDSQGQLLVYNHAGEMLAKQKWHENCIPHSIASTADGTLLVSDNRGRIFECTPSGVSTSTWENKFKGCGRIAITTKGDILVTSSEEKCVHRYNSSFELIASIAGVEGHKTVQQPHYVTSNTNDDIIISDYQQNIVFAFKKDSTLLFTYDGTQDNGGESRKLKCVSSICCDPFNNILVADFTSDCIHLVSKSGQFLGDLLTKHNGISCPNFLFLDTEGHLFVGQYGGEIKVFQYLSCVKHA